MIDGNFASEHLKMRRPDDDVALTDGDGYFVSIKDYETHLAETSETKQVVCYLFSIYLILSFQSKRSTCNNHNAVNRTNVGHDNLEATGIAAIACARHGCFYPHTVVDFQKGEQYVLIFIWLPLVLTILQTEKCRLCFLPGNPKNGCNARASGYL